MIEELLHSKEFLEARHGQDPGDEHREIIHVIRWRILPWPPFNSITDKFRPEYYTIYLNFTGRPRYPANEDD